MKSGEQHIGGGFARFGQLFFPIFLSLFLIVDIIITRNDFNINNVVLSIIFFVISIGIIIWLFMLSDTYIEGDLIVSYKLFSRKEVQKRDILSIRKSRLPLTITLRTAEKKIRFQLKISDMLKNVLNSDGNLVIKELESRIYPKEENRKSENAL